MSYLTRRERDAVILFVSGFGIALISGFLWGLGLSLFSATSIVTFLVYASAGLYLVYRTARRAGRWGLAKYRRRSA